MIDTNGDLQTADGLTIVRRGRERGHANHGWLDTFHTFSFADYYDEKHMGFRTLRVINEDTIAPGTGFGTHGHRDMEIVTYVLGGALEHRDSMGSVSVLRHGDVQRMTAGTGVTHSEFNHSKSDDLHLLQIWLTPRTKGLDPSYEERNYPTESKQNQLRLIVSPDGADGSLEIHQDVRIFASVLSDGEEIVLRLLPARRAWVQVASGGVRVNGLQLEAGDGAGFVDTQLLRFEGNGGEFLLFDLS